MFSPVLTEQVMQAFYGELVKEAVSWGAVKRVPIVGSVAKFFGESIPTFGKNVGKANWHALTGRTPKGMTPEQYWQGMGGTVHAGTEGMNLHTLPGFAKGLVTNPIRTIKGGLNSVWNAPGWAKWPMRAGMGLTAYDVGKSAFGKPNEYEQSQGMGRAERIGRSLGNVAMLVTPMPLLSSMAVGTAMSSGAGRVGRVLDKKVFKRSKPHVEPPGSTQLAEEANSVPVERQASHTYMQGQSGGGF